MVRLTRAIFQSASCMVALLIREKPVADFTGPVLFVCGIPVAFGYQLPPAPPPEDEPPLKPDEDDDEEDEEELTIGMDSVLLKWWLQWEQSKLISAMPERDVVAARKVWRVRFIV